MDLPHRLDRVAVAIAAGVAAVAGSYAVVGESPAFVATPIANAAVTLAPGALVTLAITLLGDLGSKLAYGGGLAATALVLGAVAGGARLAADRAGRPLAGPLVGGAAVALVGAALSTDLTSAVGAGVGAALVATAVDVGAPAETTTDARRSVLAGVAALAAGTLAVGGRRTFASATESAQVPVPDDVATLLSEAEEKSFDVESLEPLVSDDFYTVDIASVDPDPTREDWSVRIHGAVGEETTYTFEDIEAMDHEHQFNTLRCVGETLNGRKLDTALWTGVPLMDLLDAADLQGEYVMLRAADGFYEEFPVDALESGFLAVGMNGQPLPRGHGAPARALIPGHWGEINVKWLTEIEVLDEPATGYWEERGWHGTGPVNTVAKLWAENHLDDGRVEVAGPAYAGTRGIERVEVSTDGGETWADADLSDPLPGEDVWRQWVYRYEPPAGEHEVVVRATDGTGTLQPRDEKRAYPSGPSGWVSRTVQP
ncbi:DMSO/TMAO reductase YedYZ, molybdopterin-dependent catalytic subunit [Haloplanus vescus]|uniref:DMSO/TMAO reductase YedYZ, molybdopterin-dependent catalytic subunit n=1 Tax=Haloplanus vescus TaxID=555874 RepID=A0A1H3X788_9EURY|nr:molybdopterin-dependent oxidoreductase [Haloplanus vescus]SDZ95236.1 DMSO/TMAO reductase YedYZ, molybdopterin-dependent catalytic subunit [Haloplanus vescus]